MDASLTVQVFSVADDTTWAVTLQAAASVAELRLATAEHDPTHELRFLFNGRILGSEHTPLRDYGVTHGSRVPAVRISLAEATVERTAEHAAYGFERLRETGFSEEEVREFRASFHGVNFVEGAAPDEPQMQREERWIRAQGSHNRSAAGMADSWHQPLNLPISTSGRIHLWPIAGLPGSSSFGGEQTGTLVFLFVGFLIPWLPLVMGLLMTACGSGTRIPRQTKAALIVGAMCNLTMGIVRSYSTETVPISIDAG
eukprot:TRINITY_DN4833_c0_g1_i2.p1 TRINITY_DN4833_c0_g1~~TRINITY_DN4833_c0_g1_i2.p1  ORF type:complete len:256 (+),score=49.71 TRINITY_DN4833_c0_g1_i2:145-912(+)